LQRHPIGSDTKRRLRPLVRSAAALAFLASAIGAGCASTRQARPFEGQRAYDLVAQQLEFGPRIPGSEGSRRAGEWIQQELEHAGWQVKVQSFNYHGIELRNFIGVAGPVDDAPVVLGAHYDTRPKADLDPSDPSAPVPGANDGGSGVAVLLELAAAMPPETLPRAVWLVFFDAEDSGGIAGWEWIVGSSHFVETLEAEIEAAVIVDMVGDADLRLPLELNSTGSLQQEIWITGRTLGYSAFIAGPGPSILDDHTPFLRAGIPAVDIIDFEYPPWHTQADTLDKILPASLEQVGRTLQTWLSRQP
jgi:acetylornithine deacetylase/succinyl-diaminopimelate desuccinylase-like protein